MSLKLAISGKGGVGKTTLAGTLARLMAADGRRVLAVDADPDANLASAIGLPAELRESVRTISREKELIEERTGAKAGEFGQIFSINPEVSDIADKYATSYAGVDLLVMGAVQRAGGGCACPENVLLKSLISHLVLKRDEVVILDMEAGIEHLGRSTAMGVDLMLVVVEPGQRSVETGHRVQEMASAIGIKGFAVVVNKSTYQEEDLAWMKKEFGDETVIGLIPQDRRVAEADRTGRSIVDLGDQELLAPFQEIQKIIEERFENTSLIGKRSSGVME
jgi:CO dehydrogenase maturation factor